MTTFLFPLLGYLSGSLPFSVWITRLVKGVDVRDGGSGHAGATNTIRQAGFGWGALVFVLDLSKGFIPIYLASRIGIPAYVIIAAAVCAVVGHCFPVFAQFRGGMGLATAGGCLLALNPLSFLVSIGLLILCVLILRHAARASVLTGILAAPALWILNIRDLSFWAAMGVGTVIALRFLINWNRQYRELWLDRK
ncbi:MAG: glycerol-3-phosphate acyltransferase [Anaerolineales bacterium]|nr:glycerol-3-phosphate acyltransferase [Anaerolineales bacterium]